MPFASVPESVDGEQQQSKKGQLGSRKSLVPDHVLEEMETPDTSSASQSPRDNTARNNERRNGIVLIQGNTQTIEQAIHGRLLEAGSDIGILVLAALFGAQHCALQPRKRKMRLSAADQRAR